MCGKDRESPTSTSLFPPHSHSTSSSFAPHYPWSIERRLSSRDLKCRNMEYQWKCRLFRVLPPEIILCLCDWLEDDGLVKFGATCKLAYDHANPMLYRHDAGRGSGAKALIWAIFLSGSGLNLRNEIAWAIVQKSKHHAGRSPIEARINMTYEIPRQDVAPRGTGLGSATASPALLCAAVGSTFMMRKLMTFGANLRCVGRRVNEFMPHPKFRGNHPRVVSRDGPERCRLFTPLSYAFLRGNQGLIELLLQCEHEPFLTTQCIESPGMYSREPLDFHPTTLHMLSEHRELGSLVRSEVLKFPGVVNHVGATGWAPLHLAVLECHPEAFSALLAQPSTDVDVETHLGRTPLLIAIEACWKAREVEDRDALRHMVFEVFLSAALLVHFFTNDQVNFS